MALVATLDGPGLCLGLMEISLESPVGCLVLSIRGLTAFRVEGGDDAFFFRFYELFESHVTKVYIPMGFKQWLETVKIISANKMGEITFWVDGRRETFWMDAVHFVRGGWFSKLNDEEAYQAVLGMVEDGRAERPPERPQPKPEKWVQRELF